MANLMCSGPALQPAELQCRQLDKSSLLSGGLQLLQPSNPFDEEKGEARSSHSCHSTAGNTPTEQPPPLPLQQQLAPGRGKSQLQQRADVFISGLAEARLAEPPVAAWLALTERYCKAHNLMWHQEFATEHPVQELERLLSAVLIRHQYLGGLVLSALETEGESPPSRQLGEIIRLVHQTKWSVVRTRQQLNRSYKEVCAPILERLRFLLYEVRPAISPQQRGLSRLPILQRLPRFRLLVRRLLQELRSSRQPAKPEDLLNATIQQQQEQKPQEKKPQAMPKQAQAQEQEQEEQEEEETLLRRLNEHQIRGEGELDPALMQDIVDFALQDNCDVETARRAMYCQMQRFQLRLAGLQLVQQLLELHGLLDATQYSLLNGFLGLHLKSGAGGSSGGGGGGDRAAPCTSWAS